MQPSSFICMQELYLQSCPNSPKASLTSSFVRPVNSKELKPGVSATSPPHVSIIKLNDCIDVIDI